MARNEDASSKALVVAVYAIAAVAAWFAYWWIDGMAQNHPWRPVVPVGAGVAVVFGVYWLTGRSLRIHYAVGSLALVTGAMALGWITGKTAHEGYISYYCAYGASSREQFATCRTHVTSDEIDDRASPAARFARGEINCGQDAGPLCDEWQSYRDAEPTN